MHNTATLWRTRAADCQKWADVNLQEQSRAVVAVSARGVSCPAIVGGGATDEQRGRWVNRGFSRQQVVVNDWREDEENWSETERALCRQSMGFLTEIPIRPA